MILTALYLAFLIPIPWLRGTGQERTDQAAWQQLLTAFEQRGIAVIQDHPRCQEANLYGFYVRGVRQVVVCPRGDQSNTLRHEGWHAVQSLCLKDQFWVQSERIEQQLSSRDRRDLDHLVSADRWLREAEARVMAQRKPDDYLEAFDRACRDTLPLVK